MVTEDGASQAGPRAAKAQHASHVVPNYFLTHTIDNDASARTGEGYRCMNQGCTRARLVDNGSTLGFCDEAVDITGTHVSRRIQQHGINAEER